MKTRYYISDDCKCVWTVQGDTASFVDLTGTMERQKSNCRDEHFNPEQEITYGEAQSISPLFVE